MFKKNSFWLGFIPGLIIPSLFAYVFIKTQYKGDLPFFTVVKLMMSQGSFKALLAVSAFPNIGVFLYFMKKEWWMSGRGMTLAMMLFAIAIVYMAM